MAGSLPAAVLATEDRRFYSHYGIDPVGLLRALYVNLTSGNLVQGGSTITQQLAKNVFLTPERSLHRKGQELLLSFWLEHNFTKNEILELYLNRVYFGSGTYGVDAAARRYFGHPAKDVTLLQAAMLAGMLKAPSRYNPNNDPIAAATRAQIVIQNMVDAGFITEEQANAAGTDSTAAEDNAPLPPVARYFSDWALDQVSSYIGFTSADLVVQTTLDPRAQSSAERNLAQVPHQGRPEAECERSRTRVADAGRCGARHGRRRRLQAQPVQSRDSGDAPAGLGLQGLRLPERLRARPDAGERAGRSADLDRKMAARQLQ